MTTMTAAPALVNLTITIKGTAYTVEMIPAGEFGTKAYRLSKLAGRGEVYDVVRTHDGLVQCDCPSYEMTFKGTTDSCKHGRALVAVGLLDSPDWSAPDSRLVDAASTRTAPEVVEPETPARPGIGEVLDGMDSLPRSIRVVANLAGCGFTRAKRAILARFAPNGSVVQIEGYDVAPKHTAPEPETADEDHDDDDSESFADDWADAVGLPVIDPPADEDDQHEGQWNGLDSDIGWERPAPRPGRFLLKPVATLEPARPALVAPGRYDLATLVDGQAAYLRGLDAAPFTLMADRLDQLAREIRHTGAKSVSDFTDRLASLEEDYADRIRAEGWDLGYAHGLAEAGCC